MSASPLRNGLRTLSVVALLLLLNFVVFETASRADQLIDPFLSLAVLLRCLTQC
jgi:hypothetical protein